MLQMVDAMDPADPAELIAAAAGGDCAPSSICIGSSRRESTACVCG